MVCWVYLMDDHSLPPCPFHWSLHLHLPRQQVGRQIHSSNQQCPGSAWSRSTCKSSSSWPTGGCGVESDSPSSRWSTGNKRSKNQNVRRPTSINALLFLYPCHQRGRGGRWHLCYNNSHGCRLHNLHSGIFLWLLICSHLERFLNWLAFFLPRVGRSSSWLTCWTSTRLRTSRKHFWKSWRIQWLR